MATDLEKQAKFGMYKSFNHTFDEVIRRNSVVYHIMKYGGTAEDCVVALFEHNEMLQEEIIKLQLIAPEKLKFPDGQVMIYRCPDEMVPEREIGGNKL